MIAPANVRTGSRDRNVWSTKCQESISKINFNLESETLLWSIRDVTCSINIHFKGGWIAKWYRRSIILVYERSAHGNYFVFDTQGYQTFFCKRSKLKKYLCQTNLAITLHWIFLWDWLARAGLRVWDESSCRCFCSKESFRVCEEGKIFDFGLTCRWKI